MKVLLVEDEPAAVKRMRKLLLEVGPAMEVVADIPTVAGAVRWFKENPAPDLAFFDVRLADGDSFEVFKLVDVGCPVIFLTAFSEYALNAFRVNALDYLMKPVVRQELSAAISKFNEMHAVRELGRLANDIHATEAVPDAPVKRFLIRYGDRFRVVEPKDIAYVHSRQKNTFLRTMEGRDLPLDESLDRLEKQLDKAKFFRLNRQLIVNFECIKEILAYSKSRVKVLMAPPYEDDAVVSSERASEFKRWLSG
ncbi:MAG: response regulator transcription factor [Flavobacteriales bacterium]|nr:response regulator transcription factor [Flavobacteriales bacterium]